MEYFDDDYEGIIIPSEKLKNSITPTEEKVISELMLLTHIDRFYSRQAMTEFLKRIFLQFNVPLSHFTELYFGKGIIVEIQTPHSTIPISISKLTSWIGITQKLRGIFDYTGTTYDYIQEQGHCTPSTIQNPLRKNLHVLSTKTIKDCETLALFFTDMIEEAYFINPVTTNKYQYSREPVEFICFEKNRVIHHYPLHELTSKLIRQISLIIGNEKLERQNEFISTSNEDKLEVIIRIAYGIKNGFIDPRGRIYDYNQSIDPYFHVSFAPIMPQFLASKNFIDIYHYFEMYEWIDLLPEK